jgi:hypothetical protein
MPRTELSEARSALGASPSDNSGPASGRPAGDCGIVATVAHEADGVVPRDAQELGRLVGRVPEGWSVVEYDGRRYGLTRVTRAGGKSTSVFAEELGGSDVVSANVYRTSAGQLLKPCEMPAEKVLDFLERAVPTR